MLRAVAQSWTYHTADYQKTVHLINEFKTKVVKRLATPKVNRPALRIVPLK